MIYSSCKSKEKVSKEVKAANKEQADFDKVTIKEYDDAVEKHQKQQSDYAKQMVKDMKKLEKRNNANRKRTFWDRLFRRNCN